MNSSGNLAALINLAVVVALGALAYFVFPRSHGIVIAVGVVAGFALASLSFARTLPRGAGWPQVIALFVVTVAIAYAIPWVIGRELRIAEVGGMREGLLSMSIAVGALLWGVALRMLWNARKLIR